jgi:cell division protein FtsB
VDDDGEVEDCDSCAARQAEIERLRARVAQLEAANASLRQAVTNRDYERPPHYE